MVRYPPPSLLDFDPVFANNTWSEIALASELGFADQLWTTDGSCTKDLQLSTGTVTMSVFGINHDELAFGNGTAGITLININNLPFKKKMNSEMTIDGGYEKSELRQWLNEDFIDSFPKEVKSVIKPVYKYTCSNPSDPSSSMKKIVDKCFLLSVMEFMGEDLNSEILGDYEGNFYGDGYQPHTTNLSSSCDVWLRTPWENHYYNTRGFITIGNSCPHGYNFTNSNSDGVVLFGFCI